MAAAPRVLLLPGFFGSSPDHWQSHWERTVPGCLRVVQRDWETPPLSDWVVTLDGAVAAAGPEVVLVAHSAACALVASWAAATSWAVHGALLVAPADTEAPSFPTAPAGWQPMPLASLGFPSIVVASSNDEFVSLERARMFATAWGSRLVEIGAAGHINAASGHGPWNQGKAHLATLLEHATRHREVL
jgi:serine hydrolase